MPIVEDRRHDYKRVRAFFGLLTAAPLPVLGAAFPLAALFAVILIPVRTLREWPRPVKALVFWAIVGAAALAMTAAMQRVAPARESIVFFLGCALFLVAVAKLTTGTDTAAELLAYVSVGAIAFYALIGTAYTQTGLDFFWKFGASFPVIVIALWFANKNKTRLGWTVVLLLSAAGVSLFANFRSQALICVFVVLLIMVKGRARRFRFWKILVAGAAMLGAVTLLTTAMERGVFGYELMMKSLLQSDAGPGILAGRVEPPLSLVAIAARPFIGWGNANAIDSATFSTARQFASNLGMYDPSVYMPIWIREDGAVSLHSVALGSWAEGGILAAVFPMLLLVLFVRGIWYASGRWAPLVILVSIQSTWDLLFSPWSNNKSIILAACAILVCWAIEESRKPKLEGLGTSEILVSTPRLPAQRR